MKIGLTNHVFVKLQIIKLKFTSIQPWIYKLKDIKGK